MIEEVLQSVKQTEQQAAKMVADAEEAALSLRQATEQEVASQWEQTKSRAKEYRYQRLENAQAEADGKVAAIRANNEQAQRALWEQSEGKIDAAVDKLMEKIANGDC